jgi:hypothetical protein
MSAVLVYPVGSSNSPYTTALIKHLPTPALDIEQALRVRDEVLRATKNKQEPFRDRTVRLWNLTGRL